MPANKLLTGLRIWIVLLFKLALIFCLVFFSAYAFEAYLSQLNPLFDRAPVTVLITAALMFLPILGYALYLCLCLTMLYADIGFRIEDETRAKENVADTFEEVLGTLKFVGWFHLAALLWFLCLFVMQEFTTQTSIIWPVIFLAVLAWIVSLWWDWRTYLEGIKETFQFIKAKTSITVILLFLVVGFFVYSHGEVPDTALGICWAVIQFIFCPAFWFVALNHTKHSLVCLFKAPSRIWLNPACYLYVIRIIWLLLGAFLLTPFLWRFIERFDGSNYVEEAIYSPGWVLLAGIVLLLFGVGDGDEKRADKIKALSKIKFYELRERRVRFSEKFVSWLLYIVPRGIGFFIALYLVVGVPFLILELGTEPWNWVWFGVYYPSMFIGGSIVSHYIEKTNIFRRIREFFGHNRWTNDTKEFENGDFYANAVRYPRQWKIIKAPNANIKDLGFLSESNVSCLRILEADINKISNLEPLSGCKNLRQLSLANNRIIDVRPLASLSKLAYLNLRNNKVCDHWLFKPLTQLEKLDLRGNRGFDNEQVQLLRESLPDCEILTDFDRELKGDEAWELVIKFGDYLDKLSPNILDEDLLPAPKEVILKACETCWASLSSKLPSKVLSNPSSIFSDMNPSNMFSVMSEYQIRLAMHVTIDPEDRELVDSINKPFGISMRSPDEEIDPDDLDTEKLLKAVQESKEAQDKNPDNFMAGAGVLMEYDRGVKGDPQKKEIKNKYSKLSNESGRVFCRKKGIKFPSSLEIPIMKD